MKKLLFLLALSLCSIAAWAYDFSAVAPTGQTLYYNITGSSVKVTYPNAGAHYAGEFYEGYTEPAGALTIPETITNDGITYPVTFIDNYAFCGCSGLTSVSIPNSVTSIGWNAFEGCVGLTSATIPNSVTSIGEWAFRDCDGLTSVVFNATSCVSMGSNDYFVFEGCTNLTSLTIGENVTKIPDYAFCGCSGLTHITIPENVESIGRSAFFWNNGNLSVQFNAIHCDEEGYVSGTYVYYAFAPSSLRNLNFGSHVQYIPDYLCLNDSLLTSIEIPNSVTSIGDWAFLDCTGLTSVTIGNSVTSIPYMAFAGCSSLTSVTIPNSVTSISYYAFSQCDALTSVTIGSGVNTIIDGAFAGCDHLSAITCMAVVPPEVSDVNAFEDVWKGLPLTVPSESVSQYQSAYAWREFTNIIGADLGIKAVESKCDIQVGNGDVVLYGTEGQMLRIYDIQGRMIVSGKAVDGKAYTMPSAGVYLIRIGNHPTQKVVVR